MSNIFAGVLAIPSIVCVLMLIYGFAGSSKIETGNQDAQAGAMFAVFGFAGIVICAVLWLICWVCR